MMTKGLSATLDKFRLIGRMVALSRHDRWPRGALLKHQARRLEELRRFALAHSPFYRRLHRGLEFAPLAHLPVLTKDQLMQSFDEVVTTPRLRLDRIREFAATMSVTDLFDGRYHVVATSGTTGNRGFFVFTKDEWRTLAMASVARGLGWSGSNARASGRGVVMASTIPWHMTARASAELRRVGLDAGRLSLDAGDLVDVLVEKLNRYQPTVMMVYPSVMQILAAQQIAGRLRIAPGHIQCTSEVLTADARDAITQAFGVVPANLYAASECGCLAASCGQNDGLHISEDLLIVESVDENNRPVPAGEMGAKTLVTVLASRTLPLIRYELSDRIALEPAACACGKPYARIREIGGRQGDVLRLPGRDGAEITIAPAQITACLRGSPVKQWQLRVTPGALSIACVCAASEFQEADIVSRLGALLTASGAQPLAVQASQIDRLERGATGKTKLVTTLTR
jgi:putative adenylate-forming enzyme